MVSLHFQAGDLAGVLGGLTLRVVKVGRDRDDGLGHRLAQVGLGVGLELAQDHRRNFLRRVCFSVNGDLHPRVAVGAGHHLVRHHRPLGGHLVVTAAHEALDGIDGVLGVDDVLALGGLAHQALAVLRKSHNGRQQARTLGRGDNRWIAAFHDGDDRIGRPQVDAHNFSHICLQNPCRMAQL